MKADTAILDLGRAGFTPEQGEALLRLFNAQITALYELAATLRPVRLLTEASVLGKMDWPSNRMLRGRIRSAGFPRPYMRQPVIGDQWLESEVDAWIRAQRGRGLTPRAQQPDTSG